LYFEPHYSSTILVFILTSLPFFHCIYASNTIPLLPPLVILKLSNESIPKGVKEVRICAQSPHPLLPNDYL
jgi:hypothetical protein